MAGRRCATLGEVMTVLSVTTLNLAGGRWDEFVESQKTSKAILEKHGAKNVRLLAEIAGSMPSGSVISTFEADDLAALGKVLDAVYADPEILAMMQSSGSSGVTWTGSLLADIPLS